MRRLGFGLLVALALGSAPAYAVPPPPAHAAASESAAPEKRARSRPVLHGVVNLNNADEITLELLPGIGPARADRIVEWRKGHPFKRVEELAKVKGIGRKTVQRLKAYLAVSGASTLAEEAAK